jgi:hypothetical protein
MTNLQVQINVKQLKRHRHNPDETAEVRSEAPTAISRPTSAPPTQRKSKKASDSYLVIFQ